MHLALPEFSASAALAVLNKLFHSLQAFSVLVFPLAVTIMSVMFFPSFLAAKGAGIWMAGPPTL
jgi:hypothetical protein